MFTRVINHWVIVRGTRAARIAGWTKTAVRTWPDGTGLELENERGLVEKPLWGNNLRRFGAVCLRRACLRESGFVNHSWIVSNQFVPKAFLTFAAIAALT